MRYSVIFMVLFLLLLTACGQFSSTPINPTAAVTPASQISPEAAKYLNDALDIMEKHSINKAKIDWPTLRAEILSAAAEAQTPADTYPFIKLALSRLNDHHSIFLEAEEASAAESGAGPTPMPFESKLVENKFGYVAVPGYWGLNEGLINRNRYAKAY
jgi:hypothetical protein